MSPSAVVALLVLLGGAAPAWGHGKPEPPKRVLIIVLDQFRPDLVDKFDMRNVRALMRDGVNFENAYLGHMASETVITHNVITSGQLPKDMGWADEAFRDSDNVLGVGEGLDVDHRLAHARPVQPADRPEGLRQAGRLPAREAPRHQVHRRRPEGLRGPHLERADRRHLGHLLGPQLRLRRRRRRQQVARPDRPQRAALHLGAELRALLRRLLELGDVRHRDHAAGLDVPARRQPLRGRQRPRPPRRRRLDHRRRPGHDGARAVERHAAHARLDRQGEPHVGRHHRRRDLPAGLGRGAGAPASSSPGRRTSRSAA